MKAQRIPDAKRTGKQPVKRARPARQGEGHPRAAVRSGVAYTPGDVLALQSLVGNAAVQRSLATTGAVQRSTSEELEEQEPVQTALQRSTSEALEEEAQEERA